jgi:hypothetical protein
MRLIIIAADIGTFGGKLLANLNGKHRIFGTYSIH